MSPSSGYMFPARTPREIVQRMNAELVKALNSQVFAEKVIPAGSLIVAGTPEQFAEHVRRETEKWGAVIRAAGIKAE